MRRCRSTQRLPCVKGAGSCVTRKCETDEGLASPYGRGAPNGAERANFPSQSLRDSSPKVGAKGDEGYGLPHQ